VLIFSSSPLGGLYAIRIVFGQVSALPINLFAGLAGLLTPLHVQGSSQIEAEDQRGEPLAHPDLMARHDPMLWMDPVDRGPRWEQGDKETFLACARDIP
jgi:hypothetical protein